MFRSFKLPRDWWVLLGVVSALVELADLATGGHLSRWEQFVWVFAAGVWAFGRYLHGRLTDGR